MQQSRLIVHAGTGKTATTYLQKTIFPRLCKENVIVFLNEDIKLISLLRYIINTISHLGLDNTLLIQYINEFRCRLNSKLTSPGLYLLSDEMIHGWDPGLFDHHLSLNKLLFKDLDISVEFLFVFRESESYLRSLYIQSLHQQNVTQSCNDYFLKESEYLVALKCLGSISSVNRILCAEKLDYRKIFREYSSNFSNVCALTMKEALQLQFISEMNFPQKSHDLILSLNLVKKYSRKNISYSNVSISLTRYREAALKFLDLTSLSSYKLNSNRLINILLTKHDLDLDSVSSHRSDVYPPLLKQFHILLSWRFFLQRIFDPFFRFPKADFPIPSYLYKEVIPKNNNFLKLHVKYRSTY